MAANENTPLVGGGGGVRVRQLGSLSLIAIMYFAVAGGPEGTEMMVQTGGPLPAFIGVLILAFVFAMPVALMTTELSTAFPENGGFVLWSRAAFGDAAGGVSGWLQFSLSCVDSALYPGLFVAYLTQGLQAELGWTTQWAIQGGFIAALTGLNLLGVGNVGHSSAGMMLFLLLPFAVIVLLCVWGAFAGTTPNGWVFSTAHWGDVVAEPDWPKFMLVLLWNMGWWESASVLSGEVKDVAKVFPPALAITVALAVLNYILPIAAFVGLDQDYAAYTNGYYIDIANKVGGPFWSSWLGVSQCVSAAGLFTNGLVTNAFLVCGMGEQGMVPTVFAWRFESTKAPAVAIFATLLVTVGVVLTGDFATVLAVDMLFYSVGLLIEISALFWLRHTQPHLERPYKIPLDGVWLGLAFLPSVVICFFVIATAKYSQLIVAGVLLVLGVVVLVVFHYAREYRPEWFVGVAGVQHIERLRPEEVGGKDSDSEH